MLEKPTIVINGKEKSARPTHRSIADVAWNQFVNQLSYKAEEAGGLVIKVNPKNTTKMCSACGKLTDKDLSQREHVCSCGYEEDRDLNASRNILRLGLQSLASRKVA
jgi:putative transposase